MKISMLKKIAIKLLFANVIFLFGSLCVVHADSYSSYARYSPEGFLLGSIKADPDGSLAGSLGYPAIRNTYNSFAQLEKIEQGTLNSLPGETVMPAQWGSYGFVVYSSQVISYDSYGRKVSLGVYDKNNSVLSLTEYNYDAESHLKCTAVRMSLNVGTDACKVVSQLAPELDRITQVTYNERDLPIQEARAVDTAFSQVYVRNEYDGTRLTSQTDANNNRTELKYDAAYKRLQYVYYPSAAIPSTGQVNTSDYVEFRYDLNGNKNYERKRNGAIINYQFDNNNRMIFKDVANNAQDVYYDYDLRGLLLSSTFASSSGAGLANTYDGFGNIKTATSTMGGASRALTYHFDLNNNREWLQHPDNTKFTYSFDFLNRVTGVSDAALNILKVNYQDNGRRKSIARLTSLSTAGITTSYNMPNGVQLESFAQSFMGSAASNNSTTSFIYNAAAQVISLAESNTQYYYRGNENRTGVYEPDGLNRYKKIAGQPMGYDANSNMTNDGSTIYTYDDENRLISASNATLTASLTYDPNGRLFQTNINGTVRQYLYDGDALVAEFDGTNVMQRRYVHGDQVDEPWVQYNGSTVSPSDRRYLLADYQGSIIVHASSSPSVLNKIAYDAYGIPASANVDSFAYTGQIWLPGLNLYYYKARIYSPKLGRFLQTDPIGYKDDMDLYSYVGNDPINKADPTGTRCEGAGSESSCKIDRVNIGTKDKPNWIKPEQAIKDGYITSGELTKLEGSITAAYQHAQDVGDKPFQMPLADGKNSVTLTGNQVAQYLAGAKYLNYKDSSFPHRDKGTAVTNIKDQEITFKRKAMDESSFLQMRTTIHEAFHLNRTIFDSWGNSSAHEDVFSKKAEEFLGIK